MCDDTVTTQTGTEPKLDPYDPGEVPVFTRVHTTLTTKVSDLLAHGWQPVGGILSGQSGTDPNSASQNYFDTTPRDSVATLFCQAIVKYK